MNILQRVALAEVRVNLKEILRYPLNFNDTPVDQKYTYKSLIRGNITSADILLEIVCKKEPYRSEFLCLLEVLDIIQASAVILLDICSANPPALRDLELLYKGRVFVDAIIRDTADPTELRIYENKFVKVDR